MCLRTGGVKLLDFGIAKAAGENTENTEQGLFKGKLAYVAPAQVLHREEVIAADVSEVEHLHDVRVAEQRSDARFLHEHVDEIRRARSLGEDALDDERLPETLRARHHRAIHLGHTAGADPVQKDVSSEAFGLQRRGACRHNLGVIGGTSEKIKGSNSLFH